MPGRVEVSDTVWGKRAGQPSDRRIVNKGNTRQNIRINRKTRQEEYKVYQIPCCRSPEVRTVET